MKPTDCRECKYSFYDKDEIQCTVAMEYGGTQDWVKRFTGNSTRTCGFFSRPTRFVSATEVIGSKSTDYNTALQVASKNLQKAIDVNKVRSIEIVAEAEE